MLTIVIFILEKGNILINDNKLIDSPPTKVIDGSLVALNAALCLLYLKTEKNRLPIAI